MIKGLAAMRSLSRLSDCSSQATTSEMAAPSRMERCVEVVSGPWELVHSITLGSARSRPNFRGSISRSRLPRCASAGGERWPGSTSISTLAIDSRTCGRRVSSAAAREDGGARRTTARISEEPPGEGQVLELSGVDHDPWVGETHDILAAVEEFVSALGRDRPERRCAHRPDRSVRF
jgi:hypothetical protein